MKETNGPDFSICEAMMQEILIQDIQQEEPT